MKSVPDAAEIQQRIALSRSPVTHHRASLVFCRDQEIQKFAFGLFYFLAEAKVSFQIGNRRSGLAGSEVFDYVFPSVCSNLLDVAGKFLTNRHGSKVRQHQKRLSPCRAMICATVWNEKYEKCS